MFDRLVESTNEKRNGRAGRIFLLTALVYGILLSGGVVATILGLNPALADALSLEALVAPPPPPREPLPQPSRTFATKAPTTAPSTMVPKDPPPIADPDVIARELKRPPVQINSRVCYGCPTSGSDANIGVIGGDPTSEAPPPPPLAVKAKPTPEPEPAPAPKPILKVSQISPGLVLRRVSPQYPVIAKNTRQQGAVQVQVLISEEGRVMNTQIVSGHPLLRAAAEEAARQWLFKPTMLNDVPVKVQGILTFNFTLN